MLTRLSRRAAVWFLAASLVLSLCPAARGAAETPMSAAITRQESLILGGEMLFLSQTAQHNSAGVQEERVLELAPHGGLMPVVVSGDYVYNTNLTLTQAAARLTAQGYTVVAGLNGDFYNTSYNTPVGLSIQDGRLLTTGSTPAVGFTADGRTLIDAPNPIIHVTAPGGRFAVDNLNRIRTAGKLCLYTPDFSTNTRTNAQGRMVVVTMPPGASLRIGQSVTGVVKEVLETNGAYTIGANEFVLAATSSAEIARMDGLAPGDELTFTVTVGKNYADWETVTYACGGLNRLVTDGVAAKPGTALAPRTAVGIKADGTAVFLTVDGRRSGYSNGLSLNQMAVRMAELGCVQALELDGGGSTAMGVVYPGLNHFSVVNSPSEGSLRKSKNYIFFVNPKPATGVPAQLHLYPDSGSVYRLDPVVFDIRATDAAGHAVTLTDTAGMTLSAPDGEQVSPRAMRLHTTGSVTVTATLGAWSGQRVITVTEPPVGHDTQAPEIESDEPVVEGDTLIYRLTVRDGGYPIAASQISVTHNGAAMPFVYDPQTARLTLALPAAAPQGYSVIILTAADAWGNYAKRVFTQIGQPAPGTLADADECAWGADMLRMLDAQDRLLVQTIGEQRIFEPNRAVTRIEMYEMALHFMGVDLAVYDEVLLPFIDIEPLSESELRVARAAYAMGLLYGQSSAEGLKLAAYDALTRADFCVIAARLIPPGLQAAEPDFDDTALIADYARAAVGAMAGSGIVLGIGHNRFAPADPVTRAQVAKVLMNLFW